MRCRDCNSENAQATKFCGNCGAPLRNLCEGCGFENPSEFAFCGRCGSALRTLARETRDNEVPTLSAPRALLAGRTRPSVTSGATEGERKTLTALFADIKGSTELLRDLDPEMARAIIDPVLHLMIVAVHRYDGYVAQSTGDGIFAMFGAPVAHEDHPQRALHAALAIQEELRRYGDRLQSQGRPPVEVRIGVNTGEVVLRIVNTSGHTEYLPVGFAAHLAARMQTVAAAGGIVISEGTRRLVEGYFELRALGPTAIKGVAEPVNVYEVVGAGPLRTHFELAARRGLTKFVGREGELAQMRRALELAMAGQGQLVAVVAEAGIGKSRLFHEFKAALPDKCRLLEAYSVSHGKASAWLPVLELLRRYFRIENADDPPRRREKVRAVLAAPALALNDVQPYLLGLLGIQETPDPLAQMDAQTKRRRTLEAIKRIILRESLNQPTVVIFEDLHWIDVETQALLNVLADGIANSRALLLVNYRPEYRHEWTNRSYYSQLHLDALDRQSAGEMLSTLLGETAQINPLKRLIIERTEGNPFFIEEIVQALFEDGALVRNGKARVTRPLSNLLLPPTVQGILAARIDRLSPEQKDLLQMLSVIGRELPLELVREVAPSADIRLDRLLAELQAGEFIVERPALGMAEYVFKHALTHEVAYNSIPIERRKILHEKIGTVTESLYSEHLDEHLRELAYHFGRSAASEKAIEYFWRAGEQARNNWAYSEAVDQLTKALELLAQLPADSARSHQELRLQIALGASLAAVKGFAAPELEPIYQRSRELSIALGDGSQLIQVLLGSWTFHHFRLELRHARDVAERLLELSQSVPIAVMRQSAYVLFGITLFFQGELLAAREHLERSLSFFDATQLRGSQLIESTVGSMGFLALALWNLGYAGRALSQAVDGIAIARRAAQPAALINILGSASLLHACAGYGMSAREEADEYAQLAEQHGLAHHAARAIHYRGIALLVIGQYEESILEMQRGISALRATGAAVSGFTQWFLAEGLKRAGRIEEALAVVNAGLASAQVTGEHLAEPAFYTVRGDLLLLGSCPDPSEAEGSYRRAIEVAQQQEAKSCNLRAAIRLARLLQSQGRRYEAVTMLADIYGWFTEGFDTADLKEAKALLDELST